MNTSPSASAARERGVHVHRQPYHDNPQVIQQGKPLLKHRLRVRALGLTIPECGADFAPAGQQILHAQPWPDMPAPSE